MDSLLAPPFDTKIAVLVSDDLASWQRLNVTAFLVSGITAARPGLVGQPYRDADGQEYLPLLGMPILIFEAPKAQLATSKDRAVTRGIRLALYTRDMFSTGHDQANRDSVSAVRSADLDLVGIALHGPKNAVDKVVKGAHLHP